MLSSTCRVCSRIVRDGDLARNEEHGASTQIDADGIGEDRRDARALDGVDATRRLPGQIDAGPFHGREDTIPTSCPWRGRCTSTTHCATPGRPTVKGVYTQLQNFFSTHEACGPNAVAVEAVIFTTLLVSWN